MHLEWVKILSKSNLILKLPFNAIGACPELSEFGIFHVSRVNLFQIWKNRGCLSVETFGKVCLAITSDICPLNNF